MNFTKATILSSLAMIILTSCNTGKQVSIQPEPELEKAIKIYSRALVELKDTSMNPRSLENGEIRFVRSRDWTSGFFPGILWQLYEYTGDNKWKVAADHYSMIVEREKCNATTHDMGFKMYCSFGNGYRLTGNPEYKEILIESATTLMTRYNPVVGSIRSWDHNGDKWDYPVIIDNMMNLELLFWAFRETGDSSFFKAAVSHAETTMRNHFREDYSSYHVISYDTLTGQVVKRNTHQGYADESAWARGQAWGLYGFAMTYRETGDERFLEQAKRIAAFILNHPDLPEDLIPYWDFNAPGQPDIPRDVSAAAITASALYELSRYCPDEKEVYTCSADRILASLASDRYLLKRNEGWPFLLDHSVGNHNRLEEVDVPIIYADYYYIEALLRKLQL